MSNKPPTKRADTREQRKPGKKRQAPCRRFPHPPHNADDQFQHMNQAESTYFKKA